MDYFSKKTIKFKPVAWLPQWLLYTATFGFLLIVFAGWYFFLFSSLTAYHRYYQDQLPKLQATIKQLEHKNNNTAQLKKDLLDLKANNAQAQQAVDSVQLRIQQVFDVITNAGLQLVSFNPDQQLSKKWYTKRAVSYVVKGSYANILQFFESLSHSGLCVQCKQVTINKLEDGLLQAAVLVDFIEFKD